ncbi:MAG: hypothetical protein KGH53_00880 [Candidatus Micrarchaeota archaeon]|nr:hypothetical protein [Candidatus Micrarchaeota archaeon]
MHRVTNRAQAAVDFMLSYGIAFMVILIAIAVIFKTGLLNPLIIPPSCSALPGFSCSQYSINATTGILTFTFAQATGGTITIQGLSCSSQKNSTGDKPRYGNIYTKSNTIFYPANYDPANIITNLPTTTSETVKMYCYNGGGKATGALGNAFFGYIWLNYTISGYGAVTQEIASITGKYS